MGNTIKPKDVNWRDIEDITYLFYPNLKIMIKTDVETRFSYCRNIQYGIDVSHNEKVLEYAFL